MQLQNQEEYPIRQFKPICSNIKRVKVRSKEQKKRANLDMVEI